MPEDIPTKIVDVNYDLEKTWSDYPFDSKAFNAVLDFKSSSGINLWVDHHKTGRTEGCFDPAYTSFDPDQPSASHSLIKLIKNYNPKFLEDNKLIIAEFLHWDKIIDSAQYDDIEQIMKPKDNAILFDMAYQLLRKQYEFFVKSLVDAELNFYTVLTVNPLFKACGEKQSGANWKCFFYCKEKGQCTDNGVVFLDLIESNVNFARYTPFKAFEKKVPKYSIVAYILKKDNYGISVSGNPFLKGNRGKIDLSEIAKKYGGGGHKDAAGINCKTKDEVYFIMQQIGDELESLLKPAS